MFSQKSTRSQQLWNYLFEDRQVLQIHQSKSKYISTNWLKLFRFGSWLLMTTVLVWILAKSYTLFIDIKYLTEQGFIFTWLYFSLVVQQHWLNQTGMRKTMKISHKLKYMVELVYELALCLQVPITIIEWLFLFEQAMHTLNQQEKALQVIQHSLPILLLLIDLACNAYRFKSSRLLLITGYALVYMLINMAYSNTQKPIYIIINWKSWYSHLYVAGAGALIVGTHLLGKVIFTKWKRVQQEQDKKLMITPKLSTLKSARAMKEKDADRSIPDQNDIPSSNPPNIQMMEV